ncbi:MAG: protein kinase domain-containing protein [Gemmatimonadales bacterium]
MNPRGGRAHPRGRRSGRSRFIAPEQALGESAVDGRAHIYATGCVAYWLLTGQLVFTSDTAMGMVMQHLRSEPAPASSRTSDPISGALDRLVLSCLAKDPAERPQSARELLRRLGEADCPGAWTDERAREWWAEHQPNGRDLSTGAPS